MRRCCACVARRCLRHLHPYASLGQIAGVMQLTIGEAAARLHTSPSTLRSWEQRLGYPTPTRTGSGRRLYEEGDITLLGDALARGLTISSAVREVRAEQGSHVDLLTRELTGLRFESCDRLLEAAITLRGVSRAFDGVVLEAVDEVFAACDDRAVTSLVAGWARERAHWHCRLAATPASMTVVIADNSDELGALRVASAVLQLELRLRGFATHALVGSALAEVHAVAGLVGAGAVVFVGALPASIAQTGRNGSSLAASFRTPHPASPRHSGMALSPRPRQAADELWSAVCGAHATSGSARARQVNGRA
jgi:DNA-binding transcriptional MerR regulator